MSTLPYLLTAILFLTLAGFGLWLWLIRRTPSDFLPFEDFKTQMLKVGDWEIRFHQSGQGPHLLLLHGIGANLYCWRELVPLLNQTFTVTAIDLPGFGRSSKLPGVGYGLDEQAERLGGILDALGVQRTYIVGNSMGANIGLWFAYKHSERVTRLGLIAPATSPGLMPLPLDRLAWLSGPASLLLSRPAMAWAHGRTVSNRTLVGHDRVEETFFTYGRRPDAVRSFLLAVSAIRDARLLPSLKNFSTPTLILWGSKDRLVNRKVIESLKAALPKAYTDIHIGGGHHLQEDEPAWVAGRLTEFFQD